MSILRVSEVVVRESHYGEFMEALTELVATFPADHDGLEMHHILVDRSDRLRVAYISQWRDEAALIAYAGPMWESDPVTFPNEREMLAGPMTLRHFNVLPAS